MGIHINNLKKQQQQQRSAAAAAAAATAKAVHWISTLFNWY